MATKPTTSFKYLEIARALQREIEAGNWALGERLPGETHLARRFNVAHMTVRQAINSLIVDSILVRVPAKGTFVFSGNPSSSTDQCPRPMVLLFPADAATIDPYYFPELLAGFEQTMEEQKESFRLLSYDTIDGLTKLDPRSAIACLLIERDHVELAERLRHNRFPVLAINHPTGRRSIPSVYVDDASGIESGVDHLVSLGHVAIAFLKGPNGNLDGEERLHGFRSAVKRYGLLRAIEVGGGYRETDGYQTALELLAPRSRPTALICASDLAAIGAVRAAREYGLDVPGDLSIVGFGDFSVADYVTPRLTTIRQPRVALGCAAASALIAIAAGTGTMGAILCPDLILRESTTSRPPGFS